MHPPKDQNLFQKAANLKQLVELESKAKKLCTIPTSDFIVLQKIGVGGDAEVFEGVYLDKKIAVKKFSIGSKLGGLPVLRSFVRETELLSLFQHKNIITCFGAACESLDIYYLLLELIPGGTLEQLLHKKKVKMKDASKVLQFALDIASGMRQVHQRNIIHRDLKPANLMVDSSGALKIVDFSTGRVMDESGHMTGEAGSFRWTAPEVLKGERYTDSADVYSFAVVMWEIISGSLPFSNQPPMSAALSVVRGNRPGVITAGGNCPEALAALLNRCWDALPSQRPRFDDIVPLLESCIASLPQLFPPPTNPGILRRQNSAEPWSRISWRRLPFTSVHGSRTATPHALVGSAELNASALASHYPPTPIHIVPLPLPQLDVCPHPTSDPPGQSSMVLAADSSLRRVKSPASPLSHTSAAASASCPSLSTMTLPPTSLLTHLPCLSPSPAPAIGVAATAWPPRPCAGVSGAQSCTASSSNQTSPNLWSEDDAPWPPPSPHPMRFTASHPIPASPVALPPSPAAAAAVGGGGGGGGGSGRSVRGCVGSTWFGCRLLFCFAPLAHLPPWRIRRRTCGVTGASAQPKRSPRYCAPCPQTPTR